MSTPETDREADALERLRDSGSLYNILMSDPDYWLTRSALDRAISLLRAQRPDAVCTKLRPGAPCPTPASCRDNGCSAVERELFLNLLAAALSPMEAKKENDRG